MTRSVDELWGLMAEAERMPFGSAQIALVEQVLRHVDAGGDRELAYATRMFATKAYIYGGEVVKSFVTFSWCLSDFDRDPAPFHQNFTHQVLWHFKYMITALTKFPEIPLHRTYAVLDDMQRRYREGGHSMQAVHKHRFLVARHLGAEAEADEWYERWNTTPRDELSDCAGCDPSTRVAYLSSRGRDEEAVALAEPVLAGRLTCSEQPQSILRGLLVPYLRTGRLDAAADAHRRGYRLVRGNLADLWDIGDHIEFCARTGNEPRGLEILQRHIDWLDRAPSPAAGMHFAASAALLLRRLTELGSGDLVVHRREHGERPAADVPAAVLADELARFATDLSLRFDARNGTTSQSGFIAATLAAEPYGIVLPLSPSARRTPAVTKKPATPKAEPAVPADGDAATLLELAESYELDERDDAVDAVLSTFDGRFGGTDLDPATAGRRADLLGGQRWRARDPQGAATAWQRAADLLTLAGDPSAASESAGALGLVRCLTGAVDEGLALIERDIATQREHGNPRRLAGAQSRLAMLLLSQERLDEALAAQDSAEAAAAELADPRLTARYAMRRAQILAGLHRHEEAAVAAGSAREFYRANGLTLQSAMASFVYGQVAADPNQALAAFDEVLASGEPSVALEARLGRGRALRQLDRAAEAVDDFVEAVALCAEQGLEDGGALVRQELADVYQQVGRLIEAAEVAEEAILALDRLGLQDAADGSRHQLAGLYRELNDGEAALARYDELVGRMIETGNNAGLGQAHEEAADLLFRLDRDAQAAERFGAAAAAFRVADEPLSELRALRRRVPALHWADDVPAGEEAVAFAGKRHADLPAELAERPVAVWERAMLGFEASRLLMSRGRYAEALPHLTGGPQRLRDIGATDDADQVEGMLGEALLRSGDPAAAAELLRRTVAGMGPDAPTLAIAVKVLGEALRALGRADEERALLAEYSIKPTDG